MHPGSPLARIDTNFASQRRLSVEADKTEPNESGPIQIGVIATPPMGSAVVLAPTSGPGISDGDDGFVVMAGSEVPSTINPGAPPIVEARRGELAAAGALVSIPEFWLASAYAWRGFRAIAAKVITGAHVDSSKWVTPRYPHGVGERRPFGKVVVRLKNEFGTFSIPNCVGAVSGRDWQISMLIT